MSYKDAAEAGVDDVYMVWGNIQGTPEAAQIWSDVLVEEFSEKQSARRCKEADYEVWLAFVTGDDGTGECMIWAVHVDEYADNTMSMMQATGVGIEQHAY